uniref:Ras-GEF domain-containing protein n=1 Tax=Arcella intermedia TaxID=1963864 RepID=A0A6B2LD22_9EUKA
MNDFLLTYRSFTTPEKFFELLLTRYKQCERQSAEKVSVIRIRVFSVFKTWVEKFWYDFESANLAKEAQDFFKDVIENGNEAQKKVAERALHSLERQLAGDARKIKSNQDFLPPVHVPKPGQTEIIDFNSEEIARQLTLIDWEMWKQIQPYEFLNSAWTAKGEERERAKNILRFIERSTYISNWVASTICRTGQLKYRTKICAKWIDVSYKLKNMGNFNGCMAIMAAFNLTPVFRLKQTFEVSTKGKSLILISFL